MVYALTDETYSLVCGEDSKQADNHSLTGPESEVEKARRHRYYFTVSLLDQIYWVTGSVCGSLLGSIIPFNTEGIDFALTALFVTVLWSSGFPPANTGRLWQVWEPLCCALSYSVRIIS